MLTEAGDLSTAGTSREPALDPPFTGIRGDEEALARELDMIEVYCYEVAERMHSSGKPVLLTSAESDELKMMLMGLKRFAKTEAFNSTATRQEVAVKLIEKGK